ncbi:hypothetical protein [Streptomyces sp. NPDC014894]|uniref:hypothetical protein n=1 Tax=Streptomyces sp. NPDC014894 TaxID=3364931 RepID=UPI0036F574AE
MAEALDDLEAEAEADAGAEAVGVEVVAGADVVAGRGGVIVVVLIVGDEVPPAMVRLNEPRRLPQVNWTECSVPGRAAELTVATDEVPDRMVTASKTPDDAVAVLSQPLADT